jgi:hypothetical protein
MKKLFLAAAAVALITSPVLAQTRVIVVDPVETGSVSRAPIDQSVPGSSTASPHSRTQGNNAHTGGDLVPSFQQGSSQEAGGPANELNPGR